MTPTLQTLYAVILFLVLARLLRSLSRKRRMANGGFVRQDKRLSDGQR